MSILNIKLLIKIQFLSKPLADRCVLHYMNLTYDILLLKYLNNELPVEDKFLFEEKIVSDVRLSERLKQLDIIPESQFVKLFQAVKQKLQYRNSLMS